ncbi:MAG: phosphate acyltransferase PlsX [Pseudomonadota bacterium]
MAVLAIDCMGADYGPIPIIKASVAQLHAYPDLELVLVGDSTLIENVLVSQSISSRCSIVHASEVVTMEDSLSSALRHKKDSSMRVALQLLAEQKVQGVVSCGNTAALSGLARYVIKMLPGVDRPAIIAPLPSRTKTVYVLDLGANVDVDSETLFQFGIMGSLVCSLMSGRDNPRVGLLNVGVEAIKGNDQVKQAARLLESCSDINYCGFVEGHEVYQGDVDVVVCDGFVGNVLLKASEGLSNLIFSRLKASIDQSWLLRTLHSVLKKPFQNLSHEMNPDLRNGASLIGLNGVVVKSHGSANKKAFESAIATAIDATSQRLPERVRLEIEKSQLNRALF